MANEMHTTALRSGNRSQRPRVLQALLVLAALVVGATAMTAQAQQDHYYFHLARTTATDYVFDTALPADFAAMLMAAGPQYSKFKTYPRVSSEVVNGSNLQVYTTDLGWKDDRVDRGRIAFAKNGVSQDAWFSMDTCNPLWPAVASQLKAQAKPDGDWWYVTVQLVATTNPDQSPVQIPIPMMTRMLNIMDGLVTETRTGEFYPSVQIPQALDALRTAMLTYGNHARREADFRRKMVRQPQPICQAIGC